MQVTSPRRSIDEALASAVLRRSAEVLAPRAKRWGVALEELEHWAGEHPVAYVRPDAGAVCCMQLDRHRFPDEAVAAFYAGLAEREVRVAPGRWFGEEDRVFRVGLGHLPPADFTEALSRVADALTRRFP